jgi:hypothetical protein
MTLRYIASLAVSALFLGCSTSNEVVKFTHREGDIEVIEERLFDQTNGRERKRYSYYIAESGNRILHGTSVQWTAWTGGSMRGVGREYVNGTFVREVDVFVDF